MNSIYELQPGMVYVVRKGFEDFYGNDFRAGETLTFVERFYLPYEGGHTLVFAERRMYLQDELHAEILQSLGNFIAPLGH